MKEKMKAWYHKNQEYLPYFGCILAGMAAGIGGCFAGAFGKQAGLKARELFLSK